MFFNIVVLLCMCTFPVRNSTGKLVNLTFFFRGFNHTCPQSPDTAIISNKTPDLLHLTWLPWNIHDSPTIYRKLQMNKTTNLKDVVRYGLVGTNVSDEHDVYTFYLEDGSGRFLS